ncbi:Multiple PDZ domain protein [Talaromyces islandicus]|uniref:Multiple PDZ domain protein n=1 Tax=Talaromyces islandicus TaxID=28573 RepID=A0A0U1M319_TALIS|nr:Multiple PDZ domain protein [Talaromyces islandicus]
MDSLKLAGTVPSTAFRRARPRRVLLPSLVVIGLLLFTLYRPPKLSNNYVVEFHGDAQLSPAQWDAFDAHLRRCDELQSPWQEYPFPAQASRSNPRWNPTSGQKQTTVLRNVTLFDGDSILNGTVDIVFERGVIRSVSPSGAAAANSFEADANTVIRDYNGQFVTPGLVDMHSHHLGLPWPSLKNYQDVNEINDATGPLTPMVRSLDGLKPYDIAATIIASGGVTTSLILPGSANIMGGEAYPVKNFLRGGEHGEEVVEELLLEHGIAKENRRRFLKMACGENPRRVYKHTRMGNAWHFRHHMARAKDLLEKQDTWCAAANSAKQNQDTNAVAALLAQGPIAEGGLPEELELDSSVAMLRGKIGINVHCYEPEDFEDMLLHAEEFGFRVQAFHHALSAWKVPELIKARGHNITIATFADFSLYKKEGYDGNLWAGKILAEHGVPVAYKSDHVDETTNARYLLSQAATAHSFGLSELLALQSVTSVPAKSLELHHRIGYAKPGYDADIAVWNSHPLSAGAFPIQVYIDGKATLEEKPVSAAADINIKSSMRAESVPEDIKAFCANREQDESVIITGISTSYLDTPHVQEEGANLTMVINSGKISCLGTPKECISPKSAGRVISLQNGHVLPGLTTVSNTLGLVEIESEPSTADGAGDRSANVLDPETAIYNKYGIHFEGKPFDRARIGGVTRSITYPYDDGFLQGVSVGIKTAEGSNPLNGGIFKDDVALHISVGQDAKSSSQTPTVSKSVATLRKILSDNKGKDTLYGKAADGKIPVVVHTENKYDILQIIKVKSDYPKAKLIIYGASEAPAVADEIASGDVPLIFNAAHSAPSAWEKKDLLVGPPLTASPVRVLADANVTFALAMLPNFDWHLANLPIEASSIAKEAGLSAKEAVDLFSTKIDEILGFQKAEKNTDFVIWEGNPLEYGASVVLTVDGDQQEIVGCWPEAE